jgi:hypothetical protein
MQPTEDAICQLYADRQTRFAREAAVLARRADRIANARMAVFAVALGAVLYGIWGAPSFRGLLFIAAGLLVAGFVTLVVWHRRVLRQWAHEAGLADLNQQAQARIQRNWGQLFLPPLDPALLRDSLSIDLDLLGPRSLFHLLALPATPLGLRRLADWLLEPAPLSDIASRQLAIAELATQLDRRQELALLSRPCARGQASLNPFLDWAEGPVWLGQRPWLMRLTRITPLASLVLFVLYSAGLLPLSPLLAVLVLNVGLSLHFCRQIHPLFSRIASREGELRAYVALLAQVQRFSVTSTALRDIQSHTREALRSLDRLRRLMDLADLRFSQLLYGVVQATTLWDFHVLAGVEAWQAAHRNEVRGWFEHLARFEALCALAGLQHDQPGWATPRIESGATEVAARQLGHPLIPTAQRVTNDVSLGPAGAFLLVTGSNMSGKSTLLRSIGVNIVLAQAGAPVCAASLSLPPVRLGASIRVSDSLGDGVSLFMAELRRLKQVVDDAARVQRAGERQFVYLLDEILHGTNTVERQIAVRRVVRHLLECGAIGAITSHDLALADVDGLAVACRAVHFQESFSDGPAGRQMTFDYQLRSGVATTTNALKLLEMVGLPADDGRAPCPAPAAQEAKSC